MKNLGRGTKKRLLHIFTRWSWERGFSVTILRTTKDSNELWWKRNKNKIEPIGAICGPHDEWVGTKVCVDPWFLQPGEKKNSISNPVAVHIFFLCYNTEIWEKECEYESECW